MAKARRALSPSQLADRLGKAIAGRDSARIRELIAQGADVNYREDVGEETILMVAARAGDLETVRALVEAGAEVNAQIEDYELEVVASALLYAARARHREVYDYLAPLCRADVRAAAEAARAPAKKPGRPSKEEKATFDAISKGRLKNVQQLLDGGVDVNLTDRHNSSLLWAAAAQDKLPIVKLLLARKADVDIRQQEDGSTALLATGSLEIARLLLAAGADFRIQTRHGQTMLMNAANFGWTELVKTFLEAGLDVRAADQTGQTALHRAAPNGHAEVVRLLAAAGAKLDARDMFQQTPEDLARAMGQDSVVQVLRELRALI
jgi:ankyrin repeat protein